MTDWSLGLVMGAKYDKSDSDSIRAIAPFYS